MISVAVIGAGRWGSHIIATLASLPDVTIAAVGARAPEELTPLADRYPVTTDTDSLRRDYQLDAVFVATPGSTHAAVALPFIKEGIATFIEKPLTTTVADARVLQQAAQQSGALVVPGHIHLYNPAYQAAKALLPNIGRLRLLYFEGTNNGPFRDDLSALWDWGPHDVYLALDMVGTLPRHVQAWGIRTLRPATTLHDFTVMKLTFPDGLEAVSVTSWLLSQKQKKATVVGAKSTIVFDEAAPQKVAYYENMGPTVDGTTVTKQEPIISYPAYDSEGALTRELRAFLTAVTSQQKPLGDLAQGLAVVGILAAAEESINLDGQMVPVVSTGS